MPAEQPIERHSLALVLLVPFVATAGHDLLARLHSVTSHLVSYSSEVMAVRHARRTLPASHVIAVQSLALVVDVPSVATAGHHLSLSPQSVETHVVF